MKITVKRIKKVARQVIQTVKLLAAIGVIVGIVWIFLPSFVLAYLAIMGFIFLLLAAEKDHEEQQQERDAHEAEVLAFEKKVGAK